MGRWKSKSRHWWVGTAKVGEGKSPGMKHFVNAMVDVLSECRPHAVGNKGDRFHFQQSGTTAAAIDKLRCCDAYLAVYCPDAGRCLSPAAPTGGRCDPYQFIDIEMFLDAAHGDEFSHSTCKQREKNAKETLQNPHAPAKMKPPAHLDPTNVHFIFLQQEVLFATWWAQMTPKKPIGIAQRFLMSFGGDADPAPMDFASFMEDVTIPTLKQMFRLIVRRVGPVVPGAAVAHAVCTPQQNEIVAELEHIVNMHRRRHTVPESFRGALPKSMYWLGTSLLLHHTISSVWHAALQGSDIDSIPAKVQDVAFAAAVRFTHMRYLAGQAILTVSVKEKIWAGREVTHVAVPGDLVPTLVRILRGTPGAYITLASIKAIDLELKRDLRYPGTAKFAAATHRLEELWRMLADVGVGQLKRDAFGNKFVHKYARQSLHSNTVRWLEENRVPGYLSGFAAVMDSVPETSQRLSLRNTDPTMSVRATAMTMPAAASTAAQACLLAVPCSRGAPRENLVPVLVSSEIIDDVLLDPKGCKQYMRNKLAQLDLVAAVTDIKPVRHNKYFLFRGVCLRCPHGSEAVTYKGTYYRRDVGVPPKTFSIYSTGIHHHDENNTADIARTFTPAEEIVPKAYVSNNTEWSNVGLTNALLAAGFALKTLPLSAKRSRWLINHKPRRKKALSPSGPPRAALLQRTLEQWSDKESADITELCIVNDPPRVLNADRVCIAFSCRGMMDSMRRYADAEIALCVDGKQSCMAHGWSILTASFAIRDRLRRTSFGRVDGKRVQGSAFTSHATPVLQCMIQVENTENLHQFFITLKRHWAAACPGRLELTELLVQIHKDYHPAIENARQAHFPKARAVNDFFHLLEKKKTIEGKLGQTIVEGGVNKKKELGWVMASLHNMRHLPTVDICSALLKGWLQRLRFKQEHMLADYLGPDGKEYYTQRVLARDLRSRGRIFCSAPDENDELWFSPHWAGVTGILPGSDCGDQPQEAFHSPWKKQLETLGQNADTNQILHTMQELYNIWVKQCGWAEETALQLQPSDSDPEHLRGVLLNRLGRSTAVDMVDAEFAYLVVDVAEHVQVIAMGSDVKHPLDKQIGAAGARMLFQGGEQLLCSLRSAGMLVDCTDDVGGVYPDCTLLSPVLRFFVNTVYVLLRSPGHAPHPHHPSPLCTCICFCRYAGCEHVEYMKFINLRLRQATASREFLPELKRRGRKRGVTLTQRSGAKALAKRDRSGAKASATKRSGPKASAETRVP